MMGLDVNGNDNSPEWGYCTAEGCTEEAFPIWKSGAEPDDPDLLLCPKHIGELIGRLEADAAALRSIIADAVGFAWSTHPRDPMNPKSAASVFERAHAALATEHPGAALLAELHAARAVVRAARSWSTRETALLPIDKGDVAAQGAVIEALRAYDAAKDEGRRMKDQ